MDEATRHVVAGISTGASKRNLDSYKAEVEMDFEEKWQANMLSDPQTSGGLLVSCPQEKVREALDVFLQHGFDDACQIGSMSCANGNGAKIIVKNNM